MESAMEHGRLLMRGVQSVFELPDISDRSQLKQELRGKMLPTNEEMMRCYFHWTINEKKTKRESMRIVIRKCFVFWQKANIPTKKEDHCIASLERLYKDWDALLKRKGCTTDVYAVEISKFKERLPLTFDISAKNVLEKVTDNWTKEFLMDQRNPKRYLELDTEVDTSVHVYQPLKISKKGSQQRKGAENDEVIKNLAEYAFDDEDLTRILNSSDDCDFENDPDYQPSLKDAPMEQKKVVSSNMVAYLDRCKVSNTTCMRITSAVLQQLGINLDEVCLSISSIRRMRIDMRKDIADQIKINFTPTARLTVHWDGKMFDDDNCNKVHRLPVVVSNYETDQLLGIPAIEDGTGQAQARAVLRLLDDWNLAGLVSALSFDTTKTNTGLKKGACVLIEEGLQKNLLHLACRHHVYELLLRAAFEICFGKTSGPEVVLFKRLQQNWSAIDDANYERGIDDPKIYNMFQDKRVELLTFAQEKLQGQPKYRSDYLELLELVILFLGGELQRKKLKKPGAFHHARWMAKSIYVLKMYALRNQLHQKHLINDEEARCIEEISMFIVSIYFKCWFTASTSTAAPRNDLQLLREITEKNCVSERICKAVLDKFKSHLWYLSEQLIALSFFDKYVSINCKRLMVKAIRTRPGSAEHLILKKLSFDDLQDIGNWSLDMFVTENSIEFFRILHINSAFLDEDPETWFENQEFLSAREVVKGLSVTNDRAERAVALMTEFNNVLTTKDADKQNLLRVVAELRKRFPNCNKETLKKDFAGYLRVE